MNRTRRKAAGATLLTLLVCAVVGAAAYAGDYAIDWFTLDGGGAGVSNASTGGAYGLSGTTGQPDARNQAMTGGNYGLIGGFWFMPACAQIPADFDGDCDVDADDFGLLDACWTGPNVPYTPPDILPPECALTPNGDGYIPADFDADGDVDQADFSRFQRCYSGQNNPADPNCAN